MKATPGQGQAGSMGNPGGSRGNGTSDENKGSIPDILKMIPETQMAQWSKWPRNRWFQYGTCVKAYDRFALRLLQLRKGIQTIVVHPITACRCLCTLLTQHDR